MSRIVFESERTPAQIDPGRADVACFVGLVRLTGAALPATVQDWLRLQGWTSGPNKRPLSPIVDLPIPIESFTAFATLFDPGGSATSFGTDYVSAAVRTFFAQGGRRCYVIRMGDPVTATDKPPELLNKLQSLLPVALFATDDPRGWHGAGHLAGLPDVSFLCLPDLPALTASVPAGAVGQEPAVHSGPEQFVVCSTQDVTVTSPLQYAAAAPRLALGDYARWANAVRTILQYLSTGTLREVQFVAALPLPENTGVAARAESVTGVTQDLHDVVLAQLKEQTGLGGSISSAFLQLSFPWLRTTGSHVLLEGLEPPDGALTGIMARNALTRGTFTNAVKIPPSEVFDLWPSLPQSETRTSAVPLQWGADSPKPLIERISLFGFTPTGLQLLSDVTTYPGENYRPARIHRLISVIRRACRRLGEEVAFQPNGPALWARVQTFLRLLMTRFWRLNALDGATIADAFSIRCDRSTMTQNDLDSGRVVAEITFTAAATIETILVTLTLETVGASAQSPMVLAEAG